MALLKTHHVSSTAKMYSAAILFYREAGPRQKHPLTFNMDI